MSGVVYIGVFLSVSERQRLLRAIPPKHAQVHADHLTVVFRPSPEEIGKYSLGTTVEMSVSGEAVDDKGQAVLVSGVCSTNGHPHITISTADGIKPVYSNELFSKTEVHALLEPLRLIGVLDTYPRSVAQET